MSRRHAASVENAGDLRRACARTHRQHQSRQPSDARPGSKQDPLAPGLYLVATPIGNLRDITLRALDVLAGADVIACEDTRQTAKLLAHYAIDTPTLAYHDHNGARVRPRLLGQLADGARIALVSDGGTPLVSDPGYKLVSAARAAGHGVVPIPGASAPLAALVASGLPTDRFLFAGFPPPRSAARQKWLAALRDLTATLLFFEAPQRLAACLADMAAALGDREAVIGREMTKRFETFSRGTLKTLAAEVADRPLKGEVTIAVAGKLSSKKTARAGSVTGDTAGQDAGDTTDENSGPGAALDPALRHALARLSPRDAAREVAHALGLPRRQVYQRALALAGGGSKSR